MIQIHERLLHVQGAGAEIKLAILKLVEKHGLTYHEAVGILLDEARSITMYGIRAERHPNDPGKKGDEA